MTPDLSRRIARAFLIGSATIDERDVLRKAGGPPDIQSAEDLPPDARALLFDLEQRAPAQ